MIIFQNINVVAALSLTNGRRFLNAASKARASRKGESLYPLISSDIKSKIRLPNVLRFRLGDSVLNTTALLFGITVQEREFITEVRDKRVAKANRYLTRQVKRILRAKNQDVRNFIVNIMLQKSKVYQIYALGKAFPKYHLLAPQKIVRLMATVRSLGNKIEYKRVWIEKKPHQFERPLGVPTIAWRIRLRMVNDLLTCELAARREFPEHQHGGTPGKGTATALKATADVLSKYKYIWEFDLKGFFDHISHESIIRLIKGSSMENMVAEMLESEPSHLQVPVEEFSVENIFSNLKKSDFSRLKPLEFRTLDLQPHKVDWNDYYESMKTNDALKSVIRRHEPGPFKEDRHNEAWKEMQGSPTKTTSNRGILGLPLKGQKRSYYNAVEALNIYMKGKETAKHLDLKGRGIPQGTNFGPLLASQVVAKITKGLPIVMYLDDGLLFSNSAEELERLKKKFVKKLEKIQVEVNWDKSRMLDRKELEKEGLKFLGTRISGPMFSLHLKSETRRGISRDAPGIQYEGKPDHPNDVDEKGVAKHPSVLTRETLYKSVEKLFERGLLNRSKYKQFLWMLDNRFGDLINEPTMEIAIKYQFFEKLLAILYDPGKGPEDMKRAIKEGMDIAEKRIKDANQSIAHRIMYKDIEELDLLIQERPNLFNITTKTTAFLLENLGNVSRSKRFQQIIDRDLGRDSRAEAQRVRRSLQRSTAAIRVDAFKVEVKPWFYGYEDEDA